MLPWMTERFGNPSAVHQWGNQAREAIEDARMVIANLLGAEDPSQILFTSGATESNNWVLQQANSIAISPFEHSSNRVPALAKGARVMGNNGFELLLDPSADLVCVNAVDNETGAKLQFEHHSQRIHHDITQAIGHVPVDLSSVDFASWSAHKFGGPPGVGGLFTRDPYALHPLLLGGGQEFGARSGTENVAGILGMAAAMHAAIHHPQDLESLRTTVRNACIELGATPIESQHRSSHILCACFYPILAETLVLALDRHGLAISSGPACSSVDPEPSPSLLALGLSPEQAQCCIRISFGWSSTVSGTKTLVQALNNSVKEIRSQFQI